MEELTPMSEIRTEVNKNMFDKEKPKQEIAEVKHDKNGELINDMFSQAIAHEVANNEDLQQNVLETAQKYTTTKMEKIKKDVDTEFKEANFNNRKDACEAYGFNEKTTPIWATKFMSVGYSIVLAIWLFIGSFTFMPVIFIAKKLSVGLKHTWLAVVFALIIYLGVTFLPILLAVVK